MPVKTILLPLRESDMSEHMLESGMRAAEQHGAHLDVLYVHPKASDMVPFATMGLTHSLREMVEKSASQASVDQAARLEALFQRLRERHGIARRPRRDYAGEAGADWSEASGVRSEEVARRGRLADLILTPRPERTDPPPKTFEAILRDTGRPAMMVPRGNATAAITGHVVIGWNGSTEAASALAAARPLLRAASGVTVLVSTKRERIRPHGEDVVDYLKCHGVPAGCRVVAMREGHVGQTILDECDALGAQLLVVGAYSRTRVQEMFLGGVTRYLLREARLPVLMVH
jgi:nucleotide-binding universal stress UspA family protein